MSIRLRPAQALYLWHNVSADLVRRGVVQAGDGDLTLRQLTLLLHIYLEPPPHTVRALAQALNVTKPVITRALDTMGRKGLVNRKRDPDDRRNVIVQRTVEGALFVEALGDLIAQKAEGLPQ